MRSPLRPPGSVGLLRRYCLTMKKEDFWGGEGGLNFERTVLRSPWLTLSSSAELERVPNKLLKPSMDCPICSNPFLDGMAECALSLQLSSLKPGCR